jgi:multiple sugar transport system substrate-binding protein
VNVIDPGGTDEQVDERLEADRVAGDLPDLAVVSSAAVGTYVTAGLAQPLTQFIVGDQALRAGVDQGLLATGKVKGVQYAMSFQAGFLVLYYNPLVFRKAGLNLASPRTWTPGSG